MLDEIMIWIYPKLIIYPKIALQLKQRYMVFIMSCISSPLWTFHKKKQSDPKKKEEDFKYAV